MVTKSSKGFTLVELIVVMAITAILGTMLVSMMSTGGHLYSNSQATMDAQSDARLAMSYITVKIRQNDVSNGVTVVDRTFGGTTYSVLTINDASNSGDTYWIYFDLRTDKLREQHGNTDFDPTMGSIADIADIGSFIMTEPVLHTIQFEVTSVDGSVHLSQDITLRSQ